ncbi:4'-phosphopantetheinyl transferase superfamily protein [Pleurocapsales cyanobacterium LEGE 10410]|nr:4'-phosphopantetheinyl transferase superfamily protein [Pleurocapsales cyanobacterium LEGE 10410]
MGDNNLGPVWKSPSQPPTLANDRVHVWRANLNLPTAEIARLKTCLSPDEVARADRFHFAQHRARFIAARGILRQLLGNYLQLNPSKVKFVYGDRGKPQLAIMLNSSLEFNVSHSQDYALYGFVYNCPIGVDLEYLREMEDALKIAQRFFSPGEYRLLASLPKKQQQKGFFKIWTAKEAYLKAIGTGLAGSLTRTEVALDSAGSPCLQAIEGKKVASWTTHFFIPASNYVAVVAAPALITTKQIDCWNWQPNCLTKNN